ncbi:MFS transporter [Nocardioides pantholopis]|uniref:MFS transporter n=1 Tax=Nocardioides pantholopis TaxID=2483798 RepID=UPI000F083117|nr:MFS transporter [Nocardioides pantholopis]
MKRSLSRLDRNVVLVVAGTCLIAGTYGLVRLAYGLFLPDIQASVSMSSAVAGYVSSGASAAYCVGALAGLAAPGRPRLLVVGAVATATLGSLGMASSEGLALFVPAAVLASAGAGFASPGLVAVVARNVAGPRGDRAQATVNAGTGPGLVAAGLLALLLPDWRVGFAISAAFTAAAGLCVLLLDRPGAEAPRGGPTPRSLRWLPALAQPVAGAFLLGAASATVWTYGRAHLISSGASDTGSILAWMALGVGGTVTVLTARALGALPAQRAWLLTTAAAAVATAGLLAPGPLAVVVLACGLFGWGFVAASSALIAWTAQLVPDRAASGTSVAFIALVLGQAAGSSAAGSLSDRVGLPTTFLLAALVTVLAAACGRRSRGLGAFAGGAAGTWLGSRRQSTPTPWRHPAMAEPTATYDEQGGAGEGGGRG